MDFFQNALTKQNSLIIFVLLIYAGVPEVPGHLKNIAKLSGNDMILINSIKTRVYNPPPPKILRGEN